MPKLDDSAPKTTAFRPRRAVIGLPVLAMVDAFVGGVSVLLVLVLIAKPSTQLPDRNPLSDVLVHCAEDGRELIAFQGSMTDAPEPTAPIALDDLAETLVSFSSPDRFSLRVLFSGPPDRLKCLQRGQAKLHLANSGGPTTPDVDPIPVFITDLRITLPEPESDTQ